MEGPVTNIQDLIEASVHRPVLGGRPQNAKRVDDFSSIFHRLRCKTAQLDGHLVFQTTTTHHPPIQAFEYDTHEYCLASVRTGSVLLDRFAG